MISLSAVANALIAVVISVLDEPIVYSFPAILYLSPALSVSITNVADFALSVNAPFSPAS